jgi:phytanoyl-CoA hydroxylase
MPSTSTISYTPLLSISTTQLASEVEEHVHWLGKKYPDIRPEQLHHNLLVDDPFIHRLVGDARLVNIVEEFIGNKIALFAAHYIAKPPSTGQAVLWHQDGTYWPLEPMEVITIWLAGTDSTVENGCMRVIPGTQNKKLLLQEELQEVNDGKNVLASGIYSSQIDDKDAVDIELNAGDVSLHNPSIVHGSNPNTSDKWRIGLTIRYIPTSTLVKIEGHRSILLRGVADPRVKNEYVKRAIFIPEHHMKFSGWKNW